MNKYRAIGDPNQALAEAVLSQIEVLIEGLPLGYTMCYTPDGQQLMIVSDQQLQHWKDGTGAWASDDPHDEGYYPLSYNKPAVAMTRPLPRLSPAE